MMSRIVLWTVLAMVAATSIGTAQGLVREPEEGRFVAIDVMVDPFGNRLAAYQIEIEDTRGVARIVGIEGGDHAAFAAPPYYDPAAMRGERVIIAAFDTGRSLPQHETRVATLHVFIAGNAAPSWAFDLQVAARTDGSRFAAAVRLEGEGTQ